MTGSGIDSGDLFEVILYAMIAGFVALRLYTVLGRTTGEEKPLKAPQQNDNSEDYAKRQPQQSVSEPSQQMQPTHFYGKFPEEVRAGLTQISEADSRFNLESFLKGAESAYDMILNAFWSARMDRLKPWVSDDVYLTLVDAAEKRDMKSIDNRIVGIDSCDVVAARLDSGMAEITVQIDSRLELADQDHPGHVVAERSRDLWSWRRLIKSNDPNWILTATESA